MSEAIGAMFKSKKFIAAIAGVIVAIFGNFGIDIPPDELIAIMSPIIAYIVGQGVADQGKEKAKVEKGK